MAEIGTILASTLDNMGTSVIDQIFDAHPFFAWLRAQGRQKPVGGGIQIVENVGIKSNDTVGWRTYREDIPLKEQDQVVQAKWDWKFLNGSAVWYNAQEKMNQGKEQVFDLVEFLIENLVESAQTNLSAGLFNSTDAKALTGLPLMVDTDNTYAELDRTAADNTPWQANEGATAEKISVYGGTDGGIKRLYNNCAGNGGVNPPDIAVTTQNIYEEIEASLDPQRIRTNAKMAELGFSTNLMIDGCTIIWDENCPSGSFYMLNSRYMKLRPHSANAKRLTVSKPVDLSAQGIMGKAVFVEWMGNITCSRPNRCGRFINKTPAS